MSWGGEPVRRDQQGKSIIRMRNRLPHRARKSKHQEAARSSAGRPACIFERIAAVGGDASDDLKEEFAKILVALSGLTLPGYFNSAQ
jgi:hypothetical protein